MLNLNKNSLLAVLMSSYLTRSDAYTHTKGWCVDLCCENPSPSMSECVQTMDWWSQPETGYNMPGRTPVTIEKSYSAYSAWCDANPDCLAFGSHYNFDRVYLKSILETNGEIAACTLGVGVKGGNNAGLNECYVKPTFVPTTSTPSTSAPTTTNPTTTSPTTNFDGLDFDLKALTSKFIDEQNEFFIELNYTVGLSVNMLNVSLFYSNCTVALDKDVTIIKIQETPKNSIKQIKVEKKMFSTSTIVARNSGSSKGSLSFCVKAQGISDQNTSVTFRKDDIKLSYDLTQNNFQVESNTIKKNDIVTTSKNIKTIYNVLAHRCTSASYFPVDVVSTLKQNDVIYICIEPNSTDVEISTFDLSFVQNGYTFEAVKMGVNGWESSRLSVVLTDADKIKIASRLVTALFENDKNSFIASGNAYLRFKTYARDFRNMRRMQASLETNSAGEAIFGISVELEKTTVTSAESQNIAIIAVSLLGLLVLLFSVFIMHRKINK